MKLPGLHRPSARRIVVAVVVVAMIGLATFAAPKLLWLRQELGRIATATEIISPLIDQPAQGWETTDIDGAVHRLADYRGKVVVLDFWYRSCGWCLRAMPQMKELTDDFAGQPVVILGVNSDDDSEDARRIVDQAQLNYVTLCSQHDAGRLHEAYKVTLWPTVLVLDQQGIVRHIHVGYSPLLRRGLSAKIRELLAENSPPGGK